jgi:hypothetical protein
MPDKQGIATSVKTRSMWFVRSCNSFQACRPFATAVAKNKNTEREREWLLAL